MKIVLVGPVYPYRGGIAHHTHFLDRALQELGHSTKIISFRRQYPAWLYPGQTDKDPSQKETPSNAHYLLDALYPWTWRQAARRIVEAQPDLVIIQWWTTFWGLPFGYLARYLKQKGIACVYLIHNVLPHEPRPWDTWLARQALSPATAFLAQTERESARLSSLLPGARSAVHPIPAYAIESKDIPTKTEARQRLQLPVDQPVLLFFGLVRPYKGLGYLIDALGILRAQGICPTLVIAGEFWENKSRYDLQIQTLQLTEQVHIFDRYIPDEEVIWYFASADLFVAPYIEGTTQSATVSAARGFGLPMIVSEEIQQGLGQTDPTMVRVIPSANAPALAGAIQSFLAESARITPKLAYPAGEWRHFAQALLGIISPDL